MKYAFLFSFYMDQPEEQEEIDDYGLEAGFLVEGNALAALAADLTAMTPETLLHHEGYSTWLGGVARVLEDRHSAVHDVGAPVDDNIHIEGFNTYEIETAEGVRALMEDWRKAFLDRVGHVSGVGPLCLIERSQVGTLLPDYSQEPEQVIELLQQLSSNTSQHTRTAKP